MSRRGINIHKRKDGRWEGRYMKGRNFDGAIKYGYVYGKTYSETKEKMIMASMNVKSDKLNKNIDRSYYFKDVLILWMKHNKIKQKGGTIAKYQFLINNHISVDLGNILITQLTATMINDYLSSKLKNGRLDKKGGLSVSYVRTMAIIIKSAMDYAEKEGMCNKLTSEIIKPVQSRKDLNILTHEEQAKLEKYATTSNESIIIGIMLSLCAGLRIGEVCALEWKDVNLKDKVIHIRHTIARVNTLDDEKTKTCLIIDEPKTKASSRDIPISSVLFPILEKASLESTSKYVISDKQDFVSPRTYEYRYHRLLKKLDINNINYHALRHTFATRCIEVGVDIKSLSEILGHSNVSITLQTYVHSSMQLKKSQMEKLIAISNLK